MMKNTNRAESRNIWKNGMIGLAVGDALGNPIQFMSREEVRHRGDVTTMEAGGAYRTPEGTWTDDSAMALATLDSIRRLGKIVPEDIMRGFVRWYNDGEYTPFGQAFDMGMTCSSAIERFMRTGDWQTCGLTDEHSNGNGALMRILPACLYFIERRMNGEEVTEAEALNAIHTVTALTHSHLRSRIGSGLYYFMAYEAAAGEGTLQERLQRGIDKGFAYYRQDLLNRTDLARYSRLKDLASFADKPEDLIRSTGYVVDTLEAAVWSLLNTESFRDGLVKAVNLGYDADSVGAVAGGLAGLFYGYDAIPEDWLQALQRRTWIEEMCAS